MGFLMVTLISMSNNNGVIGRCDSKCYNATKPRCDCICGGKNHGVGFKAAASNTVKSGTEMVKQYAESNNITNAVGVITVQQLGLFNKDKDLL